MPCPTEESLRAFNRGSLSEEETAALEAHLNECPACCERLDTLPDTRVFDREFLAAARDMTVPERDLSGIVSDLKSELSRPFDAEETEFEPAGSYGSYEVIEKAASGGMGVILRAHDPALKRDVAIKVFSPALSSRPDSRARFLREARAAAAIDHENVLPIYAVEESGDTPYIVMPFVEGPTLQERIENDGPLSPEETAALGKKVALGLAAAHGKNLIHRDVKPANILHAPGHSRTWISDFGLARTIKNAPESDKGVMAGTPQFMAPEQFGDAADIDARADLFSLGCVLFFCLTGRPPFETDSRSDKISNYRQLVSQAPTWLTDLIDSLLQKNPDKRPPSADAVAAILQRRLSKPKLRPALLWLAPAVGIAVTAAVLLQPDTVEEAKAAPLPLYQIQDTGYGDFETALNAAKSGDTLILRTNGTVSNLPVDTGDRNLTFSAAPGCSPVFLNADVEAPTITHRGRLTLKGITLKLSSAASKHQAAIRSGGGSLTLLNCWISRPGITPRGNRRSSLIIAEGTDEVIVHNTEICGVDCAAIRLMSHGTRVTVGNSFFLSAFGVIVSAGDSASEEMTEISIARSTFLNLAGITPIFRSSMPELQINISTSLILSRYGLLWVPGTTKEAVRRSIRYSGTDNLFSDASAFLNRQFFGRNVVPDSPDPDIATLIDWQKFWPSGADENSTVVKRDYETYLANSNRMAPELVRYIDSPLMQALSEDWPDHGPKAETIGPGTGFDKFRETTDYSASFKR